MLSSVRFRLVFAEVNHGAGDIPNKTLTIKARVTIKQIDMTDANNHGASDNLQIEMADPND